MKENFLLPILKIARRLGISNLTAEFDLYNY